MATQVTPPSDLSSITKALPSLSPDDLCTLQTNIATLLEPTNNDDDAKMESTLMLSEPDLADDFSLGSLDSTNIINNQFDNYLSSLTTFPNFCLVFLLLLLVQVFILHDLLPTHYSPYQQQKIQSKTNFVKPKHQGQSLLPPTFHLYPLPLTQNFHP